jgi:hypothetical protein
VSLHANADGVQSTGTGLNGEDHDLFNQRHILRIFRFWPILYDSRKSIPERHEPNDREFLEDRLDLGLPRSSEESLETIARSPIVKALLGATLNDCMTGQGELFRSYRSSKCSHVGGSRQTVV